MEIRPLFLRVGAAFAGGVGVGDGSVCGHSVDAIAAAASARSGVTLCLLLPSASPSLSVQEEVQPSGIPQKS